MPPVIEGDIWQLMLLLEAVDHSQRAPPGLSEGVGAKAPPVRRPDLRYFRAVSAAWQTCKP